MFELKRTPEQVEMVARYALTCPLGTLCAFFVDGRRGRWVRTAKLIDRNSAFAIVECLDGKKLKVYIEDFIWIKTGRFWPSFLMNIFAAQKANFVEQ